MRACMLVTSNSLQTHGLVARQAPPSMGFPRQEYWSGLPLPPPGDLPDPGIEPLSPASLTLATWDRSVVTNPPANARDAGDTGSVPGGMEEDALEKGMQTHSSILAWEIPRTEEPGGLQSISPATVSFSQLSDYTIARYAFYRFSLKCVFKNSIAIS